MKKHALDASHWFGSLKGRDVIVLGLGKSMQVKDPMKIPDLEDHDCLRDRLHACWTIGVNDIDRYGIHPDFLVLADTESRYQKNNRIQWIRSPRAKVVFQYGEPFPINHPMVCSIDVRIGCAGDAVDSLRGMDTETGLPAHIHSPHIATALALRMGAKRVGILGVDLTDERHPVTKNKYRVFAGFRQLKKWGLEREQEIVCLAPESALAEIMPVMSLSEMRTKEDK